MRITSIVLMTLVPMDYVPMYLKNELFSFEILNVESTTSCPMKLSTWATIISRLFSRLCHILIRVHVIYETLH